PRRNLDRVEARRPVPWVSAVLYGAVLLAGGYAQLTGVGAGRPVLFVAGLGVVFALAVVGLPRLPARSPAVAAGRMRRAASGLLGARAVLFLAVAAADGSGLSRALFVLIPFTAYFAFGRTVSIVLGVGCVGVVVVGYQLRTPGWYRDVPHVSDLLMFAVGL